MQGLAAPGGSTHPLPRCTKLVSGGTQNGVPTNVANPVPAGTW